MEYLTTEQVAMLESISERGIRKRIENKKYPGAQTEIQNGITRYLIPVTELSEKARQVYLLQKQQEAATAPKRRGRKKKQMTEPEPVRREINLAELEVRFGKGRAAEIMEEMNFRARVVESFLYEKPDGMKKRDWADELVAQRSINRATLYRWVEKYKDGHNPLALLDMRVARYAGAERETGQKSFHPLAVDYLKYVWLSDRQYSAQEAWEMTRDMADAMDWKIGSLRVANRILQTIPPAYACYWREGQKAWEKKFMPKLKRKPPERFLEVCEFDHTKGDFFCEHNGKAIRPWITAILDVATRMIVGVAIGETANTASIGLAYRQMAIQYGPCEVAYMDNGADFKSKVILGHRCEEFDYSPMLQGLMGQLGTEPRYCIPEFPWSKGHVERWFGFINRRFSKQQPGWCGSKPSERPAGFDEKKMLKAGKLPNLEREVVPAFLEMVEWYNTKHIHSALGMTPQEKFQQCETNALPVDARVVDMLLLPLKVAATVTTQGIRFKNGLYWHEDMREYVGTKVHLRYDPTDMAYIYCFDLDTGQLLFAARDRDVVPMFDEEVATEHAERQGRARREAKRVRQQLAENLEDVVKGSGQKSTYTSAVEPVTNVKRITGYEKSAAVVAEARQKSAEQKKPERTTSGQEATSLETYVFKKSQDALRRMGLA